MLLVYKIAQGQMWNSVMLKLFQNISLVLGHICMFKPSDTAELSVCNHFLLCQQTSSLSHIMNLSKWLSNLKQLCSTYLSLGLFVDFPALFLYPQICLLSSKLQCNMGVQVSFQISIFILLWINTKSGLVGWHICSIFNFLRKPILFSIMVAQPFPPTVYRYPLFSTFCKT